MEAADACQRNANPVLGVESFGLHGLRDDGVAIRAGGVAGQDPNLAVGEDAIDVEEDEADPAGSFSGRKIHSTILKNGRLQRVCSAAR